eukprot:CAMPEP_0172520108 /NCGR_PEP_ID=MMETSP1066-20121228/291812_1 /TAXON_ID=671091 /ORGANISM="Coscinodiscus wailesii, Strain CCMP2513" /LENGTH=205 /DNA_ID=CAMNT_0013302811 /DNA_START=18 /DNA_END=636 /DNA_ORIENTATION=-
MSRHADTISTANSPYVVSEKELRELDDFFDGHDMNLSANTVLQFDRNDDSRLRLRNGIGDTPLHIAIENALDTVISTLLKVVPQTASMSNDNGDTPLHCAIHCGSSLTSIRLLLEEHPRAVVQKDEEGVTPFQIFICKWNIPLSVSLLSFTEGESDVLDVSVGGSAERTRIKDIYQEMLLLLESEVVGNVDNFPVMTYEMCFKYA